MQIHPGIYHPIKSLNILCLPFILGKGSRQERATGGAERKGETEKEQDGLRFS